MLRQRPGAFGKFFSADPRADIIRTIGASGEIAVVPNLLPFALDSNKEIAPAKPSGQSSGYCRCWGLPIMCTLMSFIYGKQTLIGNGDKRNVTG